MMCPCLSTLPVREHENSLYLISLKEVVSWSGILPLHAPIAVHKGQPPGVVAVIVYVYYVCRIYVSGNILAAGDGLRQVPWSRVLTQVLRQKCILHLQYSKEGVDIKKDTLSRQAVSFGQVL